MNSWIGGVVALVLMSTGTMLQAQGTKADYERFDKIGGITGGHPGEHRAVAGVKGFKCFSTAGFHPASTDKHLQWLLRQELGYFRF